MFKSLKTDGCCPFCGCASLILDGAAVAKMFSGKASKARVKDSRELRAEMQNETSRNILVLLAETTARYCFRYRLLRNVFHMGWTEFADLGDPACSIQRRAPGLAPFRSDLAFLYNEADHWAPLQDKAEIEAALPGAATFLETRDDGTPWSHDFVTTADGSAHFARRTAEVLSQLLSIAISSTDDDDDNDAIVRCESAHMQATSATVETK